MLPKRQEILNADRRRMNVCVCVHMVMDVSLSVVGLAVNTLSPQSSSLVTL